ncbi:hypothetical protein D5018_21110 [Parashewanella curva]|uniref:Uncharacterized protein n=1 Tax=Parashewanella curva TaxID=2338552 RepID=A0A3L8PUK1_9GAMM|nr:hypothetical protein D5018_21110 [Parashewanella curva]
MLCLSLLSDKSHEEVLYYFDLFSINQSNCTIVFSIYFSLNFDSEKDTLRTISLNREVKPQYRKKGVCRTFSLNILGQIYKYLGHRNTKISILATHIATVKFFYPLNPYLNKKTGKSVRDFDPALNDFHNIIFKRKSTESFEEFRYSESTNYAQAVHNAIGLELLLLQYRFVNYLRYRSLIEE